MAKLRRALTMLARGDALPPEYRDHALHGDWNGFRDMHIEPDWLLLYLIEKVMRCSVHGPVRTRTCSTDDCRCVRDPWHLRVDYRFLHI